MDTVSVVGAAEVQRAAATIHEAASTMAQVPSAIQVVFEAHQRFLDAWLARYARLMPRACSVCHDDGLYCPRCQERHADVILLEAQLAEARATKKRPPTDTECVCHACHGSGWVERER